MIKKNNGRESTMYSRLTISALRYGSIPSFHFRNAVVLLVLPSVCGGVETLMYEAKHGKDIEDD